MRQWVIQAANELHLMPTTEGGLDYKMNMTEAIDGYSGHEHTIPTYPLQSDVIQAARRVGDLVHADIARGIRRSVVGELLVRARGPDQRGEIAPIHAVERPRCQAAAARRNEQPGAQRSTGGVVRGQSVRHEDRRRGHQAPARRRWTGGHRLARPAPGAGVSLGALVRGDGRHVDTRRTARLARRRSARMRASASARDVGSLEPGKLADLLVLDKNPLENIQEYQGDWRIS